MDNYRAVMLVAKKLFMFSCKAVVFVSRFEANLKANERFSKCTSIGG